MPRARRSPDHHRAWRCGAILACAVALIAALPATAGAAVFWVNSTDELPFRAADDGPANPCLGSTATDMPATDAEKCTLLRAIQAAGANAGAPGGNAIDFAVCGPFVVHTELPVLPSGVLLNGFSVNDETQGVHGCGDYSVILRGAGARPDGGAPFPGLQLGGSSSAVFGLIVQGFTDGIVLGGSGGHRVYFNGIGTDPYEQAVADPPNTGDGVEVLAGSADDVIGRAPDGSDDPDYSTDPSQLPQNDIYGNGGWGVRLDPGSGPTTVSHDFIGTGSNGAAVGPGDGRSFANGLGGVLDEGSHDVVGGVAPCPAGGAACDTNVIANNGGPGVQATTAAALMTLSNSLVGLTPDGLGALPNQGPGVLADGSGHTIGGPLAGAADVVSGNQGAGIVLRGDHITVDHVLAGTDSGGTHAIPNHGAGILASDDGGTAAGANRIRSSTISGNTGPGVQLDQGEATVSGNTIGLTADRSAPLPNAVGVLARRGPARIGGGFNVISGNLGAGVAVTGGLPGLPPAGIRLDANVVEDNGGLPVDLGDDGVTANDPLDADEGPNHLQNAPRLTVASAAGGTTAFRGTLDSAPGARYEVDVYRSRSCSTGRTDLSSMIAAGSFATDAQGHGDFALTSGAAFAPGDLLTADVISPDGSSSEFSPCLTAAGGVDLKVTQAVTGGAAVRAGQLVDVTIHVTNAGPATATGLTLVDTVGQDVALASPPAGCSADGTAAFRCTLDDLPAGGSTDLHVLLRPGAISTLTNAVQLGADQVRVNQQDDHSELAVAVAPAGADPAVDPSRRIDRPPPTAGRFLRVDHVSGSVTVRLPNGQVIHLTDYALVPVGTQVDTTGGTARIVASRPGGSGTMAGDFRGGRFRIAQASRGDGLVRAQLNLPLTCPPTARPGARGLRGIAATAAATRHRTVRRRTRHLWGHVHGRFGITGRHAATTVRGTHWRVTDTCAGTQVLVRSGVVDVTAIGHARPARRTLHAGQHVTVRP